MSPSSFRDTTVSSVLICNNEGRQNPVYYTSKTMTDTETRYPSMEKLALALVTSARRLRPYFQVHKIMVMTNFPLRQIFQKPKTLGRLMKWALQLSEYDICFEPRTSLKEQAMVDFIAELTLENARTDRKQQWMLYVDGSSNEKIFGVRMLLQTPEGLCFKYALRFNFRTSNNEAEYEALLAGFRMA